MQTLRHEIETNRTSSFGRDFDNVRAIAFKVAEDHAGTEVRASLCVVVTVNDDRMHLKVVARCNGAALRDLINALDRAGYLE